MGDKSQFQNKICIGRVADDGKGAGGLEFAVELRVSAIGVTAEGSREEAAVGSGVGNKDVSGRGESRRDGRCGGGELGKCSAGCKENGACEKPESCVLSHGTSLRISVEKDGPERRNVAVQPQGRVIAFRDWDRPVSRAEPLRDLKKRPYFMGKCDQVSQNEIRISAPDMVQFVTLSGVWV